MSKLTVYNMSGKQSGQVSLPSELFAAPVNEQLIAQALHVYRANQTQSTAHAKTRGEVRGGGRKPWRQKGTGRARQGSIRSAQWRGGGIIFGPLAIKPRRKKLSRKMRQAALASVLSQLNGEGKLMVFENFEMDSPSTSKVVKQLSAVAGEGKTMFVDLVADGAFERSVRNVDGWSYLHLDGMNVYALLEAGRLALSLSAIESLADRYGVAKPKLAATKSAVSKSAAKSEQEEA